VTRALTLTQPAIVCILCTTQKSSLHNMYTSIYILAKLCGMMTAKAAHGDNTKNRFIQCTIHHRASLKHDGAATSCVHIYTVLQVYMYTCICVRDHICHQAAASHQVVRHDDGPQQGQRRDGGVGVHSRDKAPQDLTRRGRVLQHARGRGTKSTLLVS
jgi:hypothetical protein